LDSKFNFDLDIEQLPDPKTSSNLIFKIGEEAAEKMSEDTAKRQQEAAAEVSKTTAKRIGLIIRNLHSTCANNQTAIRDSQLKNLREAAELIDTLNITNDPAITELHQELVKTLCSADAGDIRANPAKRKKAKKQANALLGKIGRLTK